MCLRFYSGEVNRQGLLLISIKLRDSISIYPNQCCHYLVALLLICLEFPSGNPKSRQHTLKPQLQNQIPGGNSRTQNKYRRMLWQPLRYGIFRGGNPKCNQHNSNPSSNITFLMETLEPKASVDFLWQPQLRFFVETLESMFIIILSSQRFHKKCRENILVATLPPISVRARVSTKMFDKI